MRGRYYRGYSSYSTSYNSGSYGSTPAPVVPQTRAEKTKETVIIAFSIIGSVLCLILSCVLCSCRYYLGVRTVGSPISGAAAYGNGTGAIGGLVVGAIMAAQSSSEEEDSSISEENERVDIGSVVPYLNYEG